MPVKPRPRPTSARLRKSLAIGQQPLDQRRPERRGRNQHRGQPARHVLLRPHHETVADHVHQEPEKKQRAPHCRPGQAAPGREHQCRHQHSGRHPSQSGHQQHWNRLQRHRDPEVGGAPHQADRDERQVGEPPWTALRFITVPTRRASSLSGMAMRGSSFTVSSTIVVRVEITPVVAEICWRRIWPRCSASRARTLSR